MLTSRASVVLLLTAVFACVLIAAVVQADEAKAPSWTRFHGPKGDNHSPETGLLKKWPAEGPKLLWTARDLGFGYSSVTVAHNLVYTAGNIDKRTVITALDLDGKVRWQFKELEGFEGHMRGTRSTPTIDGDRLYYMTPVGDICCLDARTGKKIWVVEKILERFGSKNIQWALSESLLVDGNNVICCPCGPNTAVVAFDKRNGKLVWKSATAEGDLASYASPILVEWKGLRMILTMTAKALIGVNADNGTLLFRYPHTTAFGANVADPIFHDGHVFMSSGYGCGSGMAKLTVKDGKVTAGKAWFTKHLDNHHGGVILVDGYLYGSGHRLDKANWVCLDWKTGEVKYSEKGVGKGSATYAEGMLYTLSSRHVMGLVKATPEGHVLSGQFKLHPQGKTTSRSHPVVCGGRLYIRHNVYLYAYDIKAR
jgi:outer membrane protein assembly factor BamB